MLPATFSLAWPGDHDDDKYDDVRIKELEAKRDGDEVKVWGVLDGRAHDVEVKVEVSGVIKALCYNPAGKLVWEQSRVRDFSKRDSVWIGKIYDKEKFYVEVDIDRHHGGKVKCPNKNWSSERKVIVEDVHVKVVSNDDWGDERKILETAECEFDDWDDDKAWCDYDDDKKHW
ncbi:MAG TPA: hypothetical protein VM869_09985 [Enhygromyxa sp.]|nr:hypothetical protein [Enhygromyxa sp.]